MDTPVQLNLGINAKLYRNTGTYLSPTWVEIDIVRDVEITYTKAEWEASFRGGGTSKKVVPTLKDVAINFDVLTQTQDTNWKYLNDRYWDDGPIEFLALTGPRTTPGCRGVRGTFCLFDFTEQQKLTEGLSNKIVAKETLAEHPVEKYVVT